MTSICMYRTRCLQFFNNNLQFCLCHRRVISRNCGFFTRFVGRRGSCFLPYYVCSRWVWRDHPDFEGCWKSAFRSIHESATYKDPRLHKALLEAQNQPACLTSKVLEVSSVHLAEQLPLIFVCAIVIFVGDGVLADCVCEELSA